jgi:hypothetical protein
VSFNYSLKSGLLIERTNRIIICNVVMDFSANFKLSHLSMAMILGTSQYVPPIFAYMYLSIFSTTFQHYILKMTLWHLAAQNATATLWDMVILP